uniref:Uncharacterized protein n=1 Tax=Arundo donax TaxID=35708 RepID=A0A0A9G8Q7_ARUDO
MRKSAPRMRHQRRRRDLPSQLQGGTHGRLTGHPHGIRMQCRMPATERPALLPP